MASEPVAVSHNREVRVRTRRIRDIAKEAVDVVLVCVHPGRVVPSRHFISSNHWRCKSLHLLGYDGCDGQEVTVVEMVVIVVSVAEIDIAEVAKKMSGE